MLKSAVIEEKKFKHSPRVGADNPLGPKILCQQEGLITMVICCKFKKNLFNLWSGADNPRGQNFDVNRNLLSLQSFATTFKKPLCSLILYNLFHDFIHVYSPRAGADNPLGTKGHLCLWREDSLKEKYNTKYFKIIFYLIFCVCN